MKREDGFPWRPWWFHVVVSNGTYQVCQLLSDERLPGPWIPANPVPADYLIPVLVIAFVMPIWFAVVGGVAVALILKALPRRFHDWHASVCRRLDQRLRQSDGFAELYNAILVVSILGPLLSWWWN